MPPAHPGFWRDVYPGFLQLSGFMAMNIDRHVTAHWDMFNHLVEGDGDSAEKHREFYDEYLAVMDLTAEFYLQTVDKVFVRHELPKGEMMHRDKPVDLVAIRRCAIMAIEGEKDDISGVGQTLAALDLTPNLPSRQEALPPPEGCRPLWRLQRLALPVRDRSSNRRLHSAACRRWKPAGRQPSRQAPRRVPDRFWPAANGCADTNGSGRADCGHEIRPVPPRSRGPAHLKVAMTGRIARRWRCRRRPTAKRITLRVSNATGEVVLTIPERTDLDIAQRFADSHGDWIATRLAKVPTRVTFEPGALVPLRGVPHRIVHWSSVRGVDAGDHEPATASRSSPCPATCPMWPAGCSDFLEAEARRDFAAAREAPYRRARHSGQAHHRARHQEPLGLLLGQGSPELLLAPDHGARLSCSITWRRTRSRICAN